ncbi:MAG: transporter [marine bacterium B5-7]|nr:MAG: transporter [marine bacterium B5-7]
MQHTDGLLFAYKLDGNGGGVPLDWNDIREWKPEDGVLWIHLDRTGDEANEWMREYTGLDDATASALLISTANRPRVQAIGDGLMVIMRGINMNPDDEPDDMVGLHMWIDSKRIITLRRRRLMAGAQIEEQLRSGHGPHNSSEFLSRISDLLMQAIVPVIDDLDDKVDELQAELIETSDTSLRSRLQNIRQKAINLRRYLAPQRDALSRFQTEPIQWLTDLDRAYLRETADRTLRIVEDLDSIRERAAVAQDELNNRMNERMNRTMYVLTVVAALLLPPSLLTGLFGINVAGMPGVDTEWSFALIAISIPILAVVEFIVLRWLKWI